MGDSSRKSALAQVIGLALIFVIMSVYVLGKFYVNSKQKASRDVETEVLSEVKLCCGDVYEELISLTKEGMPIAALLGGYSEGNVNKARQAMEALVSNSSAYLTVVADMRGKGITDGGQYVDLSKTDYFVITQETKYLYTANDKVTGKRALVCAIPIEANGKNTGSLYMFYDPDTLEAAVDFSKFDEKAFYLLTDGEGRILDSMGMPGVYEENGVLLKTLQEADFKADTYNTASAKLSMNKEGIIKASVEKDERYLFFASVDIGDWKLVAGLDSGYVEGRKTAENSEVKGTLLSITVSVFLFVALVLLVNFTNKYFYNRNKKELEEKANRDLLTDLSNKVATEQLIRQYILDYPDQLALIFVLDVDNFKKINDTLGHAFGDQVLRELGKRLRNEFRVTDIVGRTGGDEFIIFLKNMKDDDIIHKEADRLYRFFQNFQVGEYVKYCPTASIGVAVFPRDGKSFEELYKAADHALYQAKREGKNAIEFYKPSKEKGNE